jgi:hypothetical protein
MRLVSVIVAIAALVAAPTAAAKEITKVKVCGLDACVTTRDHAILNGLMNGGDPTVPPPMRGGVVSLRGTVTHEGETIGRTTSYWAPELRLLVAEDGTWMPLPARSTAALERVARGLEPLPPETIGLHAQPVAKAPAPHPPESGGGTDWLVVALAGAIAAAAAALALGHRPHRRPALPGGM